MNRLTLPKKRHVLALVFLALAVYPGWMTFAGETSATEPRDSTVAGGFFTRAAARLSLFDWMRGSGGGDSRADSVVSAALDLEGKKLEPYCGCVVDTIIVSGNTHTKTIAILREMATKRGECLDARLIRRDGAYLRGLAYFTEVSISADRSDLGACRLFVAVSERPGIFMRIPYPVVNYDFEKGISYGATWKIKNFRGLAEDLSVSAIRRQDKEQGASFSWNVPWFMGRRMRFAFGAATYQRLENPVDSDEDYIKEQTGASVGLGIPLSRSLVRQLWLKTNLSFEGRDSWLALTDAGGGSLRDFYHHNFVAAGAELEYDSRENRISPFSGMLHRFRVRRFTSVQGPDMQYVFYGFSDYFYLPTGTDRAVIFALDGDVREGDLPSYLMMKLGGARDVRGYSDDVAAPVKLLATVQYRARIFGPRIFRLPKIGKFDVTMNGVAFFDNGALMKSILDVDRATFHTTGGLGVEIISPFRDLLRLEIASDGTGSPAFYMTAGADF